MERAGDRRSSSANSVIDGVEGQGRLVTTRSSRILVADSGAARLLARDTRFLVDKPLAVLVELSERQEFRSRLASLPDGEILRDWAFHVCAPDRGLLPVVAMVEARRSQTAASELRWSIRRASGIAAGADRSEEVGAEIEQLLSQLAHEINQPLAAIISFARGCVLRSRNHRLRREDLESALESIVSEAHRAAALVRTTGRRQRVNP